jgi:hypothetical protein
MQLLRRSILLACLVLPVMQSQALYETITKSADYSFPEQLVLDSQGAGDYIVTNNTSETRTFTFGAIPQNMERLKAIGASDDCGTGSTVSLAGGGSCTLRIGYESDAIGTSSFDSPQICADPKVSYSCAYLPVTHVTTSLAPSDETTLQLISGNAIMAPGETTNWVIKNTGSFPANNVRLRFIKRLESSIDFSTENSSVTACKVVSAGGTCQLHVKLNADASLYGLDSRMKIQGGNTTSLMQSVQVVSSLLHITPAYFVQPTEAAIKLTNNGDLNVTNISVQPVAELTSLHGVSLISSADSCSGTLKPGQSCEFLYKVGATAYGYGDVSINFTPGTASPKTLLSSIVVQNVTPIINPDANKKAQPIQLDNQTGSGSFEVLNNSTFSWLAPRVVYTGTGVTLDTDIPDGCSADNFPNGVPHGSECEVSYHISSKALTDPTQAAAAVTASGTNAKPATAVAYDGTNVNLQPNPSFHHLSDIAVEFTNNTGAPVKINKIDAIPVVDPTTKPQVPSTHVYYCNNSATPCKQAYTQNDVCKVGDTIDSGYGCFLWFEAQPENNLDDNITATANIDMEVESAQGAKITLTTPAVFNYKNSLYIGGEFRRNSTVSPAVPGYFVRYSGNGLSPVMTNDNPGPDGTIHALLYWNGDLYVGGSFTNSDFINSPAIGKWNGATWSQLGSGIIPNGTVYALGVYNDYLIVGGSFSGTTATGGSFSNIAQWNGTVWTDLNGSIFNSNGYIDSIAVDSKNKLVVGGTFAKVRPLGQLAPVSYFAQWAPGNNLWQPHNENNTAEPPDQDYDMDNSVYALLNVPAQPSIQGAALYAVGNFSNVYIENSAQNFGAVNAKYITSYFPGDGSSGSAPSWTAIGTGNYHTANQAGVDWSPGAQVTALAYDNGYVYVGGWFDSMQSQAAGASSESGFNNVGGIHIAYDSDVSKLGSGFAHNGVSALQVFNELGTSSAGSHVLYAGRTDGGIYSYDTNAADKGSLIWNKVTTLYHSLIDNNIYALAFAPSITLPAASSLHVKIQKS